MLIDGITLVGGSEIYNAVIETGTTFPLSPIEGRMFFLSAASGPNSIGFYVYDGTEWVTSDITSITAGSGISGTGSTGDVTLSLTESGVTPGTYKSITVDLYGRATGGTNPTTLAGYGITDAQSLNSDLTAITSLSGTGLLKRTGSATWSLDTSTYLTANQNISVTGDATGSGNTSITLTLANTGVTAGTYSLVTVNSKGLATSGSNPTSISGLGLILSASDIPNLSWSKITTGLPTTLSGYGITDAVPASSLITAGTGTKITYNTHGLVTSSASLSASDIPSLDASIITTGSLIITSNNTVTIPTPTGGFSSLNAVNKAYVDALVNGVTWSDPISDPNLESDNLNTPPTTSTPEIYIVGASPTGAWVGLAGHAVSWRGSSWEDILDRPVQVGDRFGITLEDEETTGSPASGGLTGKDGDLATISNATLGSIAYTFITPVSGMAVFVNNSKSRHFGNAYTYVNSTWIEFSGPNAVPAGVGLYYSGNTLNVALGAGIEQLPTGDVGVGLYANGGLFLTSDGSTVNLGAGSQIAILINGSTLTTSSSGLKVADAGITATQLASTVAGHGLTGGAGTALAVNPASGNISVTSGGVDLSTTGVAAGTYTKLTVDTFGRTTAASSPTTIAGLGVTDVYTITQIDDLVIDGGSF